MASRMQVEHLGLHYFFVCLCVFFYNANPTENLSLSLDSSDVRRIPCACCVANLRLFVHVLCTEMRIQMVMFS